MSSKKDKEKETVIMKFPLDARIAEELEKAADELGMKMNAYIQMLLGQHVMQLRENGQKSKQTPKSSDKSFIGRQTGRQTSQPGGFMKSFNDLKCRSKLPSHVQTAAKNIQAGVKDCHEFCVEQVEIDELRFVWWLIDPETEVKTIVDIIQFEVDHILAAEIMQKNNPAGAI